MGIAEVWAGVQSDSFSDRMARQSLEALAAEKRDLKEALARAKEAQV